jgi:hypothetical protein
VLAVLELNDAPAIVIYARYTAIYAECIAATNQPIPPAHCVLTHQRYTALD